MKTENPEAIKIIIPYARVSSVPQTTEDKTGLERQLESARRYKAQHPEWGLDENFTLIDAGKSGYKGKNLDPDAALGGFLKALKEGKIPLTPTRVLHIDDMSRLSRLPIQKARALFEGILEAGVEIYVHQDSKLYTKESLDNSMDLIISLLRIEAAHTYAKELGTKIKRANEIAKKRLVESGTPYRRKPPGWLKWHAISDTEGYYEIDPEHPERVKSIKRVFELANTGLGIRGITKRLNEENTPRITDGYNGEKIKSRRWATVVVAGLLHKKTVLGYNENLTPPVLMYPPVIDEKVYYSARSKVDRRRTRKYYGRRANDGTNLFLGMTKCARCKSAMQYHHVKANLQYRHDKPNFGTRGGVGARGGKETHGYLWCHGYLNGTCDTKQIRSDWFEESFITAVSCSVSSLSMKDCKQIKQTANAELLKGQLAEVRQTLGRYTADYEAEPSKALRGLMAKKEQEEKRLLNEIENAITIDVGAVSVAEAKKDLLALMYKDWSATDTRLEARELIRGLVENIVIDIRNQSYVIHWKTGKQTLVELVKTGTNKLARLKGYVIDKTYYPSMGKDWQESTADVARFAKEHSAE